MAKEFVSFNINDYVWVRMTERGERVVNAGVVPRPDDEGWRKMQLWAVMSAFGEHTYMGVLPPIETTIRIELDQKNDAVPDVGQHAIRQSPEAISAGRFAGLGEEEDPP